MSLLFVLCIFTLLGNIMDVNCQSLPPLPLLSDLGGLLTDGEAVDRVFKCLLDQGPCDQRGNVLKHWAPQLVNGCDACTEEEGRNFELIKTVIEKKFPTQWALLVKKLGAPLQENSSNSPEMTTKSTKSGGSHFGAPLFFVLGSMLSCLM